MTLTRVLVFAGLTGTALMGGVCFAFGLGLASGSTSTAQAKHQPPVPTYQAAVFHGTPQR